MRKKGVLALPSWSNRTRWSTILSWVCRVRNMRWTKNVWTGVLRARIWDEITKQKASAPIRGCEEGSSKGKTDGDPYESRVS
jgi:hypothetical protein